MQPGEMRPPSCGKPHDGGWVAPTCHMVGKMRSYNMTGFMIVRGTEVMHTFVASTREGAEAYAVQGEDYSWQQFEAQGWEIIPVRLEAYRIDA